MNTDVKFLRYKEHSVNVYVKQELKTTGLIVSGKKLELDNYEEKYTQEVSNSELAQSIKTERYVGKQFEVNKVKDLVNTNLEKENKKDIEIAERSLTSLTRANSDDMEIEKLKKEVTLPLIPIEKMDVGRPVTTIKVEELSHIEFERRCKDPSNGLDLKKNKDLTRMELEGEIKEERGVKLETDVKEEILNTDFRMKTELPDMGFDQKYKSEFESYRMKELADMKMEEKVKKELSDMEFEEKCRREAADDVKEEDTSLDEDFDEDFEDQYYDDEFSDQYMELDQLSFNKGEHEQQNQIQQILNKYSNVISTDQEQGVDVSKTPPGGAARNIPINQKYPPFPHQEELVKNEINPEGGSVNQRNIIQNRKMEEQRIAEKTETPAGNFMTQDKFSFEINPQKSKPKEILCDICDKKLSSKSTLKNHRMLHTGEKPFSCDQCEEAFVRKPQLANHMTRAHGLK